MKKLLLLCLPALLLLASCHIHVVDTPFLAKFENMLSTDIRVEVDGYGSAVIAPGKGSLSRSPGMTKATITRLKPTA
jgi:hypothetical protein